MKWKLNHAIVYPTVDCAIFYSNTYDEIYLARKPNQDKWRFVGGFVDPNDFSYQQAALREAFEETGLECKLGEFVTSVKINDLRYKDKEDKIITTMFTMFSRNDEKAKPMDDISELKLFNFSLLREDDFVPEHRDLFRALKEWVNKKKGR